MFGRGTARGWLDRERERERRGKVEGVLRSRNGEGDIRPGRFGGRVGGKFRQVDGKIWMGG